VFMVALLLLEIVSLMGVTKHESFVPDSPGQNY
jgi:hypothetical protein